MARNGRDTSVESALARTIRDQADASDPRLSVWVSANAGTGKTHVLTMRVLRLMLAGTPPEKILCLTYTRAAAAEMSKRVFDELAHWVTAPGEKLAAALTKLTGNPPGAETLTRARTLFASAIETPGGLKVQTIHAFAERLLQRFPIEAGVTPGFSILGDDEARALRREAIDRTLAVASRAGAGGLGEALAAAVAYAADDRFDEVLAQAISERAWLDAVSREGLAETEAMLRRHFGVRPGVSRDMLSQEIGSVIGREELQRLESLLLGGSKSDVGSAATISSALAAATASARSAVLAEFFLTGDGGPRERLMTKGLKTAHPELAARLEDAQSRFAALLAEAKGLDTVTATMALARLADAVLQRYRDGKSRRGALDYDDLIDRASSLLRVRESAAWVQYKLDGGLDHILVDESQDTAPAQWEIVRALSAEFFSGMGAREEARTIFAVGDEKQSIYSFQGALPEMFAEMGGEIARHASQSGAAFKSIPLTLSFRSVEPILAGVDRVFADASRTPGLSARSEIPAHVAHRSGQAGLIEVWPTEAFEEAPEADPWSPLEETAAPSPVLRLATRIADTIKGWLDGGETLQSEDRPIRPGDILILVRKRNPFAAPMVSALKARRIPVAGADRIRLGEQIVIQDLMALGDFLTLPEDDLALASVLKSPMLGLDDDDLLAIAPGRKGTLWTALLDSAGGSPRLAEAAGTLKRWRARADFVPPYEFFASLLDKDGMRSRLLARIGSDAADAIDELLNLAIAFDDTAPPSLSGFLHYLREGPREVKRDMDQGQNEVRVMTVHGAKGLEAPIVFLPDTCTTGSARPKTGLVRFDGLSPPGAPAPFAWAIKGASRLPAIADAKASQEAREAAEQNRLLYVAITRARDRLYLAGFEGKRKGRPKGCWYDLVRDGLAPLLSETTDASGRAVLRHATPQAAPHEPARSLPLASAAAPALPPWFKSPAPREPQLTMPLAPSRLAPYEVDETGEPSAAPPRQDSLAEPAPAPPLGGDKFLRGTLTHALLQHLPSLDPATWPRAAETYLARRGEALSARTRASIVSETLAVLREERFAPLFGPRSRAEVAIVASIPRPRGSGPALKLTGQIDRLADTGSEILIVDYKTNRPPPHEADKVADVYLYQLAAYRLALGQIYAGRPVTAAILWTAGPRIMEIPSHLLDEFASRLWTLDPARLDA